MEEGDKDKDGEGRIGIIGKIETEEKNVLVGLDLRFLTFLGLEMGSGSFRAEVLLELFTFSDIAADAPPRNFLKVDFKRLTKRKCGKKLTQDTEKDFKEFFSAGSFEQQNGRVLSLPALPNDPYAKLLNSQFFFIKSGNLEKSLRRAPRAQAYLL